MSIQQSYYSASNKYNFAMFESENIKTLDVKIASATSLV